MIDLHENDGSRDTMPNIICYNTVLNACAFSAQGSEAERRRAFAVAVEIFNQMRQGKFVSPDAVSYGNMLKACANLLPPGEQRSAIAARLFASSDMASRQRGSFVKQKQKPEQISKTPPVIPRAGLLVEYGASGRDL